MKVLFGALHFAYFRNFESVVRELSRRGHQVHLMADERETFGGEQLAQRLSAECPRVSWGWAPAVAAEPWFPAAQKLRQGLDYVRFLDPRYDNSPKLRARARERAPRIVSWLGGPAGLRTVLRSSAERTLRAMEHRIPVSGAALDFLRAQRPDVLLLASLTYSRSPQLDHLKAARALGIPVGACIMSWDHLSSKALLHVAPDRVFVWNDVQRREALGMHGLPDDRIVVTGAQCYDQWFERRPERSRDAFMRALGLDPTRRLLLYVCSAMTPRPAPVEPVFVSRWIKSIRGSADPRLRGAAILVRPHPERVKEWADVDLSDLEGVVVHGRNPIDGDAKLDYFESLHYSDAVVGICTSAFLEAAIAGRPVFSLVWPQFRIHQEAMAHYQYLVKVEGGVLYEARSFDEHRRQLVEALDMPERSGRHARFLTAFLRPAGLDRPATPIMADAIETLAREGRRPDVPAPEAGVLGAAAVRLLTAPEPPAAVRWCLMDPIEIGREREERRRAVQKRREKRIRARNPRKQIARLKTHVKRALGMP